MFKGAYFHVNSLGLKWNIGLRLSLFVFLFSFLVYLGPYMSVLCDVLDKLHMNLLVTCFIWLRFWVSLGGPEMNLLNIWAVMHFLTQYWHIGVVWFEVILRVGMGIYTIPMFRARIQIFAFRGKSIPWDSLCLILS